MTRSLSLLLALVAAMLFATGCGGGGPELGRVSGTVTIDGKPAAGVKVSFSPVDGGRSSMATTDDSGNYELAFSPTEKGALVGTHNVSILAPEPSVDMGSGVSSETLEDTTIPQEYLDAKKTEEVKPGSNTIDLTYP